jgi:hypothetical protein
MQGDAKPNGNEYTHSLANGYVYTYPYGNVRHTYADSHQYPDTFGITNAFTLRDLAANWNAEQSG